MPSPYSREALGPASTVTYISIWFYVFRRQALIHIRGAAGGLSTGRFYCLTNAWWRGVKQITQRIRPGRIRTLLVLFVSLS